MGLFCMRRGRPQTNRMATRKTASKKSAGRTLSEKTDAREQAQPAKSQKGPLRRSKKDLTRWVLDKLLGEMALKLEKGEELKFGSNDILRVVQAIREYAEEEQKRQVSEIKVHWVEPEKP